VLVLVHVAILAHLLHWYLKGETLSPLEPSEAMEYSKNSVINAGLIFFALSGLATLVFGRFFCGWGCHLVAVQDLCHWLLLKVGIRPKPMHARGLLIVPFLAFVYMFLYPAIYRWWLGIEFPPPTLELSTAGFWDTFPPWPVAVATLAIAGFSIIYFLGSKGFCTYACPYGALYGSLDRLAPGRIRVTDDCKGCGHCTQVCTSDVLVHAEVKRFGMVVDSGCMKCMDCVSVCPEDALYFGFGKPAVLAPKGSKAGLARLWSWWKPVRWSTYTWGEELLLALTFAAAFFIFRGLYDSIPFLFSLGIAGIASFCTVQLLRLGYRSRVTLQQLVLKAEGKLTGAGKVFALLVVAGLGLEAHSAVVQHHRTRAEAGYDELYPLVTEALSSPTELTAEERQRAEESVAHIESLRSIAPLAVFPREAWRIAMMSGWLQLLLGEEGAFEQELEHATQLVPHDSAPFHALASYHAAKGQTAEASSWFERELTAAPAGAGGYLAYASWLSSQGQAARSVEVLRAGTVAATHPALLWLELARMAQASGQPEQAVEAFENCLAAAPQQHEARYLLAGQLYELGRKQEAAEQYDSLAAETPGDARLLLQAALLALELGRTEAAEAYALQARTAVPGAPEPWVLLSQIARTRGEEAEADRLYARAVELTQAAEAPGQE
jgi:tetratricopeptide (TPR) repeat protein/ferredoxin